MRRRRLLHTSLAVAGLGLLSACGTATPQGQHARLRRIGFLSPDSPQTALSY